MTKEIVRELLNGEWVTAVRDAGSGGGSVSEITSTDMSVTITDPAGPTVDLSASGSQPGSVRWIGPWLVYEAGKQGLQVAGGANGGTFTITDDGDTTDPIAWDASASDVADALNLLNPDKWTATGGPVGESLVVLTAAVGSAPIQMTADGTDLTVDGDPGGSVSFLSPGEDVEVEMITQEVGDIIEDIFIVVTDAFGDTAAHLAVKTDSDEFLSTLTAYPDLNGMLSTRTNYSGNGDNSGPTLATTAYGIELAGTFPYPIIPAVCFAPSPLGAYLNAGAAGSASGIARVYLKVSTPASP